MGDFSADWLSLREPVDARSRDRGLRRLLATWVPERGGLRVLDLGCGSGANLRALAPSLGIGQRWTAFDHDAALLERLPRRASGEGWSAEVATQLGELDGFDWPSADLVTASALLDLVSERWLERLIRRHAGAAFHFALSVDGRIDLAPRHAADGPVFETFVRDLQRPKGLGPALGPTAPAVAERVLREAGLQVAGAASDWILDPEDGALVEAWLRGVAAADLVREEVEETALKDWLDSHLGDLRDGRLRLRVGHRDLLALPL
ncbi:Methyltransferase domain-containing protein [Tistlia consotensis]|uniref:Methyltransferase domain-containing protein n=1 Tax=Tistlia consotensis USBA 355 TaxID=560819 RepID=A0A1Y6BHH3_9PROT|nr:class I SAM-dependent methyltransferase [Tistlia consotensis]SMF11943.1 Methyltransferase domain-containing protein [Tistlia consotensis USBA 355]SNR51502.1 Methyltransferase domain-containing protein [Tistlia consotensis]